MLITGKRSHFLPISIKDNPPSSATLPQTQYTANDNNTAAPCHKDREENHRVKRTTHSFCASIIINVESTGLAVKFGAPVSSRKDFAISIPILDKD